MPWVTRILVATLAIVLIVVGLVTTISPIPFGFALVVLGIGMLVGVSETARRKVREWRLRLPWFNRGLKEVQQAMPEPVAESLESTEP